MREIQVNYCAVCGAVEDVHTVQNRDGTVRVEISCGCGQGGVRRIEMKKGEGYWLKLPAALHTNEAEREREGDADPGESGVFPEPEGQE